MNNIKLGGDLVGKNLNNIVGNLWKLGGGELNNMNNIKLGGDLVGKNLNNIVGNLWQMQEEGSGSSHGNMSPRSGVSEHDDQKMPMIGIRSDLLPMHPVPREGLKDVNS